MKKLSTIFLSTIFVISMLVGCTNSSTEEDLSEENQSSENTEVVSVKVGAPDGLPAIAISKLSQENPEIKDGYALDYILEATSDTLSTDVMKEELDMAIVPSNMAALAYNKTSNYQIVGTIGMGSFYLVSSDDTITGVDSSLEGKDIGNIGKNLTPDITVQALLKEKGIDTSQITFDYSNEASDLVALLASGKLTTGIVPEPALSGLLSKNENLKIVASINDTWKDVFSTENGYPQSTLIVKTSFAEENKEFVDEFIEILEENINWTNENPEQAGKYAEEFGVNIKADLLSKAIERMNLEFISIKNAEDDYDNYYNILSEYNLKVIGGSIPDNKIYYK